MSRVPLIISAPDGSCGGAQHGLVEAVDIVPTLLELAGIQIPPFLQGESLPGLVEGRDGRRKSTALTEGNGWKALRTDRFRYLVHAAGGEACGTWTQIPASFLMSRQVANMRKRWRIAARRSCGDCLKWSVRCRAPGPTRRLAPSLTEGILRDCMLGDALPEARYCAYVVRVQTDFCGSRV